jgi:hypothetical protein
MSERTTLRSQAVQVIPVIRTVDVGGAAEAAADEGPAGSRPVIRIRIDDSLDAAEHEASRPWSRGLGAGA